MIFIQRKELTRVVYIGCMQQFCVCKTVRVVSMIFIQRKVLKKMVYIGCICIQRELYAANFIRIIV